MNVLVACEYSGIVAQAFAQKGHYVLSCDLLPSEQQGNHHMGDVTPLLDLGWDLMIAHPPCTHLAVSGARWFNTTPERTLQQKAAIRFFKMLADADIPKIVIENPIGIMSSNYRKPDQIIQPWQYGHGETKATCLWLKNLPKLVSTVIVVGRKHRIHRMPPGPNRAKERSRTYWGIAKAFADQWG